MGHAPRQEDAGHGAFGDACAFAIENLDFRALLVRVPDWDHQIPVVFGLRVVTRRKAGFVVEVLGPRAVGQIAPCAQVVLDQTRKARLLFAAKREDDVVGVPVLAPLVEAVDDRKLGVEHVIDHTLMCFARDQVEAPFVQHEIALAQMDGFFQSTSIGLTILIFMQSIGCADHDHFIAFFPCIDHMQHVGWFGQKPPNFMGLAIARQHAKARGLGGIKAHFVSTRLQGLGVGAKRKVMQDGVVLGDRHVMRQARTRQVDIDLVLELPVRSDHTVLHEGRSEAVVKKQQLSGVLIGPGMRRDAADRAIKVGFAQGFKRVRIDGIGHARAVPHADQPTRVVFHIGVGGVFLRFVGTVFAPGFFQAPPQRMPGSLLFLQGRSLNPAVSVGHLAIFEAHGMQHAIAVIGVVPPVGRVVSVGAIAHIQAIEVRGHLANDLQVGEHVLLVDGAVVAIECRNVVHRQIIQLHALSPVSPV